MTLKVRAPGRLDVQAFQDRRAWIILPLIALAFVLPIALGLTVLPGLSGALPRARLLIRLGGLFLLVFGYPCALTMIRLGITNISAAEHRFLLGTYPVLAFFWQGLMGLDGMLVIILQAQLGVGPLPLDLALTVGSFALLPVMLHEQAWFYGYDATRLSLASSALDEVDASSSLASPLDTLDYRVLQLVAQAGGDPLRIMINDVGLGYRNLLVRLQKLVALRYLDAIEEMHGPQLVLTTQATDTLALPVALFVWDVEDPSILRELAEARLALESRQPQKVVVDCARLCERFLRGLLARHAPDLTMVGGKSLGKATLGELVGAARQRHLVERFDENILGAINERRKRSMRWRSKGPSAIATPSSSTRSPRCCCATAPPGRRPAYPTTVRRRLRLRRCEAAARRPTASTSAAGSGPDVEPTVHSHPARP